jgi:hypothetical protein
MKATLHPSLKTLSGSLDDWTYRRVGDQVIIAAKPDAVERKSSPAQAGTRQRFAAAVAYAKAKVQGLWHYRTTAAAPAGQRINIQVTARDRPGNATTASA